MTAHHDTLEDIVSPTPGTIVEVLVSLGEEVAVGHEVAILESMKMETPITAEWPGTVAEILIAPGDPVDSGQLLFRMAPVRGGM